MKNMVTQVYLFFTVSRFKILAWSLPVFILARFIRDFHGFINKEGEKNRREARGQKQTRINVTSHKR